MNAKEPTIMRFTDHIDPRLTRLALCLGLWVLLAQWARPDVLTINAPPGQNVQLQLQGIANKDYVIQTSGDLTSNNWTTLTSGATDATGLFQATDAAASSTARFYRAALQPELQTTTSTAAALQNNAVTITLGGNDPLNANGALSAIITQLPALGTLEQFNGTPITAINTPVTDSQNRVIYVPPSGAYNQSSPYTSFSYELERASNGVTSAPQTVAVSVVAASAPVPTTPRPQVTENQPLLFQLTWTDSTPPPGGIIEALIITPTVLGSLYQVAADNVTQGSLIPSTSQGVLVTNANGWLMYVPPNDGYGNSYETLQYLLKDTFTQLTSAIITLPIDIAHVNQPPVATPTTHTGDNDASSTEITLDYSDIDSANLTIYFTALPTQGTLYYQSVGAGSEVVVGQPYTQNQFFFVKSTPFSYAVYGSPFTYFSYYVSDGSLSSASVQDTINIVYHDTPPTNTTPASFSVEDDSSVQIPLTATSVNGYAIAYSLVGLPQYGTLYFHGINMATQTPFPIPLNGSGSPVLTYTPDPAYAATGYTDSFNFSLKDKYDTTPGPLTVTINVTPVVNTAPTIGGSQTSVTVLTDEHLIAAPGLINGITIADDASDTPGAQVFILITENVKPTYGIGSFSATAAPGVTITYPQAGQIKLEGTPAQLNYQIANDPISYTPETNGSSTSLTFLVNDQGYTSPPPNPGTPLTTSVNLPVIFEAQSEKSLARTTVPKVTLTAAIPKVIAGSSPSGEFLLKRSGGDLSRPLRVSYQVKGTAINGTDYELLRGVKKLHAGQATARIKVIPLGNASVTGAPQVVRLKLAPGSGYTVGASAEAKVRIVGH